MPALELNQNVELVKGYIKSAIELLKPYRINEKSTDDKSSKINTVEQSDHIEISNFKRPKLLHHRKNYKSFISLIEKFNEFLKIFKDEVAEEAPSMLSEYERILNQNKDLKDIQNLLIFYITKKLDAFRTLKPKLIKNIDDTQQKIEKTKNELKKHPLKNIKKIKLLIDLSKNLNKSEEYLKQYKCTNKNLKKSAWEKTDSNVFKSSTFFHTIINHKNNTGMAGILVNTDEQIKSLIKNDEYKHSRSEKTIKNCKNMLIKNFLSCYEKYTKCVREIENMEKREAERSNSQIDLSDFKNACKSFEEDAVKLAKRMFLKFKNIEFTEQSMYSWIQQIQDDAEKLKKDFIHDNNLHYDERVKELADVYTDTCISVALLINIDDIRFYISRNKKVDDLLNTYTKGIWEKIIHPLSATAAALPVATMAAFVMAMAMSVSASIRGRAQRSSLEKEERTIASTALSMEKISDNPPREVDPV